MVLAINDVPTVVLPVVKKEVLLTEEFTVLLPIDNTTVVSLTLAPTLADVLKLPVLVDITDELTCVLTVALPTCKEEVVRLTFAPTLAPVPKLPVDIVRTLLLTIVEPIVKLDVERLAVELASDIFNRIELAFKFAVLLPI